MASTIKLQLHFSSSSRSSHGVGDHTSSHGNASAGPSSMQHSSNEVAFTPTPASLPHSSSVSSSSSASSESSETSPVTSTAAADGCRVKPSVTKKRKGGSRSPEAEDYEFALQKLAQVTGANSLLNPTTYRCLQSIELKAVLKAHGLPWDSGKAEATQEIIAFLNDVQRSGGTLLTLEQAAGRFAPCAKQARCSNVTATGTASAGVYQVPPSSVPQRIISVLSSTDAQLVPLACSQLVNGASLVDLGYLKGTPEAHAAVRCIHALVRLHNPIASDVPLLPQISSDAEVESVRVLLLRVRQSLPSSCRSSPAFGDSKCALRSWTLSPLHLALAILYQDHLRLRDDLVLGALQDAWNSSGLDQSREITAAASVPVPLHCRLLLRRSSARRLRVGKRGIDGKPMPSEEQQQLIRQSLDDAGEARELLAQLSFTEDAPAYSSLRASNTVLYWMAHSRIYGCQNDEFMPGRTEMMAALDAMVELCDIPRASWVRKELISMLIAAGDLTGAQHMVQQQQAMLSQHPSSLCDHISLQQSLYTLHRERIFVGNVDMKLTNPREAAQLLGNAQLAVHTAKTLHSGINTAAGADIITRSSSAAAHHAASYLLCKGHCNCTGWIRHAEALLSRQLQKLQLLQQPAVASPSP